ncbi:hypothetical protein F7725_016818, partial [Dissostichus mawsoni]
SSEEKVDETPERENERVCEREGPSYRTKASLSPGAVGLYAQSSSAGELEKLSLCCISANWKASAKHVCML